MKDDGDDLERTAGGASAPDSTAAAVAEPELALVHDEGTDLTFEVGAGQAVLDAALAQGVELAHGCRHGVCGACAVVVVEGRENLDRPDVIEANSLQRFRLAPDVRLACRARTRGSLRIRPLDTPTEPRRRR